MLVILATHPIQYQVPIWQILARRAKVPFEVWYITAHGVAPSFDPEFGKVFAWDLPLLEGYPHRFPEAGAPPHLGTSMQVGLPAEYAQRLRSGEVSAIFVPGWNVRACWEAAFIAHRHGVPVWMRGDSNDLKIDRGAKRWVKRLLLGALFRRVDRFLYVGAANRRLYESYGVGSSRFAWAPHAVDNERFAVQGETNRLRRSALRARWNIPENAFCILFAGKLIPQKNPGDVVEALRRLQVIEGDAYHGLFVGVGELAGELRSKVASVYDAEQGVAAGEPTGVVGPKVSWAGFLNQNEMSEAYVASSSTRPWRADCRRSPARAVAARRTSFVRWTLDYVSRREMSTRSCPRSGTHAPTPCRRSASLRTLPGINLPSRRVRWKNFGRRWFPKKHE
jgi:glycosyltransferase involved in cell wall biosynthesis